MSITGNNDLDKLEPEIAKLRARLRIKRMPKALTFCALCGKETHEGSCATGSKRSGKTQRELEHAWLEQRKQNGPTGGKERK